MKLTEEQLRSVVRKALISEALTRSDKSEIEKIAKAQARKYFDSQISKSIENEMGKSYFGTRGKINKFVDDSITKRFKAAKKDKDFDEAVIKVAKRVLKGLHDMHYKRVSLIDQMPVPTN